MSWRFDPSPALVTPDYLVRINLERRGITEEQDRLPAILVATFQRGSYERLVERCGGDHESSGHAGDGHVGDRAVGHVDGVPVAVMRITVGAPAAAIVLEGAIARGVRDVLVVGSAGSLQRPLPIGSTVLVEGAEREDGTSHHYLPAGEVVGADPSLTALFEACLTARGASPIRGRSWTIDAPYRETVGAIRRHREAGVMVVEMEAAAIFAVAKVRGIRSALAVAVSDELYDDWNPGFHHGDYLAALLRAADAAMDAVPKVGSDRR